MTESDHDKDPEDESVDHKDSDTLDDHNSEL